MSESHVAERTKRPKARAQRGQRQSKDSRHSRDSDGPEQMAIPRIVVEQVPDKPSSEVSHAEERLDSILSLSSPLLITHYFSSLLFTHYRVWNFCVVLIFCLVWEAILHSNSIRVKSQATFVQFPGPCVTVNDCYFITFDQSKRRYITDPKKFQPHSCEVFKVVHLFQEASDVAVARTDSAGSFPRWKKDARPKPKPMPKPTMDYLVVAERSREQLDSRGSMASSRCVSRGSSPAKTRLGLQTSKQFLAIHA